MIACDFLQRSKHSGRELIHTSMNESSIGLGFDVGKWFVDGENNIGKKNHS